ncbi:MAG: methylated-DNA--[protein]-cysteine S-methyltransferase [Longimicrobiales bacterium]
MMCAECQIPEERLAAFVAGDLVEAEELDLALHIGTCGQCRERAISLGLLEQALGALGGSEAIRWHHFPTSRGAMFAASTDVGVSRISWAVKTPEQFEQLLGSKAPGVPVVEDRVALAPAARQIGEYLEGQRQDFDLPVDLAHAGSSFQREVLEGATRIPYGAVSSYGELAQWIGHPGASRAVGTALGRNPVALIIPCHRVVRSDGTAGGYIGGTSMKRDLLDMERQSVGWSPVTR